MPIRKSYVMTKAERRDFEAWLKRHPQSPNIPAKAVSNFYVEMILKRQRPVLKAIGGIIRTDREKSSKYDRVLKLLRTRHKALETQIRDGYNGEPRHQFISGYDLARWEAQRDLLKELLDELRKV